jgi:hypothetical protein
MYDPVVLAKKYQIDWIQEMAAAHLKKVWPQTLAGWDRIAEAEMNLAEAGENPECYVCDDSLKLHRLPEPVATIRLARECDAPEIIPLAFFHLLRQPREINPDIYDREDRHARVWQVPERHLLTADDLARLLLARERIGKWFSSERYYDLWEERDHPPLCEHTEPTKCRLAVLRARSSIATSVARDGNFLNASQWCLESIPGACRLCNTILRNKIVEFRQEFFDNLSAFFL